MKKNLRGKLKIKQKGNKNNKRDHVRIKKVEGENQIDGERVERNKNESGQIE